MEQVSGAKHAIEYHISYDMAKELSMIENNDKGKQARRYFIAMEKKAMNILLYLVEYFHLQFMPIDIYYINS